MPDIKGKFAVTKADNGRRLAFGWASVAKNAQGQRVVDFEGDVIAVDELEKAAYKFVKLYREGGEMHQRGGCATLVESVVFTKEKQVAMGLPEGAMPEGWWIGFHVTDDAVWKRVQDGTYSMFSIEGKAKRREAKP